MIGEPAPGSTRDSEAVACAEAGGKLHVSNRGWSGALSGQVVAPLMGPVGAGDLHTGLAEELSDHDTAPCRDRPHRPRPRSASSWRFLWKTNGIYVDVLHDCDEPAVPPADCDLPPPPPLMGGSSAGKLPRTAPVALRVPKSNDRSSSTEPP